LYRKSAVSTAAHRGIGGYHKMEVMWSDSGTGCLDGVVIAAVW
jgi:hypothetical protein